MADDLFFAKEERGANYSKNTPQAPRIPLAERMRPRHLDEIVGQEHLLGKGKLLERAIRADYFSALLFYGPPGTGKTTLARVIAETTHNRFESLNGVSCSVSDMREKIDYALHHRRLHQRETILFIDEIHRLNKAQQDVLLPHVERGDVRFIGATTHNPYFYVNAPLLSRAQVFELISISPEHIILLLKRAIEDGERGLGNLALQVEEQALRHLALASDGDGRRGLNALELAALTTEKDDGAQRIITLEIAEASIGKKAVVYERDGDNHYDTISAFIKSIRGSDPDAALYWLAKMLYAGEDPRFIARRLIIAASEDIGLADSHALNVACNAQQALEVVGMPEGRIVLGHATVYLACAPKSNAAYKAIDAALEDIKEGKTLPVPPHLRTPTRKKLATSTGLSPEELAYHYSHDYPGNYVAQAYLPEGRQYYFPTQNGVERMVAQRMEALHHAQNTP